MKIVQLANYYNRHQSDLCEQLYKQTNGNFYFIQFEEMNEARKKLGWTQQELPAYVLTNYESDEQAAYCRELLDNADVVILGADENAVEQRLRNGKLTFKYTERIYRAPCSIFRRMKHLLSYRLKYHRYSNYYLLCAGAYVSMDFYRNGVFRDKAYKWGYFPACKQYPNMDALIESKNRGSILWVARLIDVKHPEIALEIARRLQKDAFEFHISIIGMGEMEDEIRDFIKSNGLEKNVTLHGAMPMEVVREYMEKSSIFLFTSDFGEGWGAVLNESMNSGCAVVASHAIGAVPFLLQDGVNGLVYCNGDVDDLYRKFTALLNDPARCARLGKKAYETITSEWNAEIAAGRLIQLSRSLLDETQQPVHFDKGICSPAERMKNNWFKSSRHEEMSTKL